jgi:hypothetical protein
VPLPIGAFLQATEDGRAALVEAVRGHQRGRADRRPFGPVPGHGPTDSSQRPRPDPMRSGPQIGRARAGVAQVEHRDLYRRPYDARSWWISMR